MTMSRVNAFRPALAALLPLLLAACAAATPGYEPPDARPSKFRYQDPGGGGFAEDGRYALNAEELKLDCKHLTGSIHVRLVQLREQRHRMEPSLAARLLDKARAAVAISGPAADPVAEYARGRAKAEAYNRRLAEKGCKTVDIEAGLADPPAVPPPPPRKVM